MKKSTSIVILLFVGVFCFASGSTERKPASAGPGHREGYPITLTDSFGTNVVIQKEPGRVVSVGPNVTEIIYGLGKGNVLVGRTDWCDFPPDAKSVASVGTLQEPNIETIVALKPDVVLGSAIFQKQSAEKLRELGIPVAMFYGSESFEGVYSVIANIGHVLHADAEAASLIQSMKEKVDSIRKKVEKAKRPRVYYVIDFGEYGDFTAGKGTFIAQMIDIAGGENVALDVEGWKYSIERLVEKNPDIIICSKYNNVKQGLVKANGYKDLRAVKEGRIVEIDNNTLDRQGPRLVEGLEALARILHPELF